MRCSQAWRESAPFTREGDSRDEGRARLPSIAVRGGGPRRTVGALAALVLLLGVLGAGLLLPATARADEPDGKSGVTPNTIRLPDGPGSLEGIGQSFEPDLNSGMPVFEVPLQLPPGRAGHQPELSLAYNGGWGQGEVGLGWRISYLCLQRQTDKGLPTYTLTDTLISLEGGQELVHLDDGSLRFKNEGAFSRFRWEGDGLRGYLRDGTTLTLGQSAESRITTPSGIFMWCVDAATDPSGNVLEYHYIQDGNRPYLSEIRYNLAADGTAQTVHLLYETRPDVVVSYASRHPVTAALRLSRVEIRSRGNLVRAYQLGYHSNTEQSLLASVTQIGRDGQSSLPPLSFAYTGLDPQAQPVVDMSSSPASTPGGNVELVMLDNDPLPDLVYTFSGDHRYRLNLGRGRWAASTLRMTDPETGLPSSPSVELENDGVFLMDADGNGFADLVLAGSGGTMARYYPNLGRRFWEEHVHFSGNPNFSFENPNVRLSDQNLDKRVDVLATEPNGVACWLNRGDGGWDGPIDQPAPDPGQVIQFESPEVKLADANGDGLDDLMLVRSGSVSYYPGRGECLFDGQVAMGNPPDVGPMVLDRLRVADINADGRADLVYVDYSQVTYFLNLGQQWGNGVVISGTPPLNLLMVLRFADMDASGTVDLLFADGQNQQYSYLDFAGGVRPNLLARIDNNLGQVIDIHYRSSTEYLIDAREAGEPWQAPMPPALSVVSQVDVTDLNRGQVYTTHYTYRDGAWDGTEHEFRGFAWVDKIEEGDQAVPTAVNRFHFDTGLTDECRKGQILETWLTGDGGSCLDPAEGCYQRQVNQVDSRSLAANSQAQEVRFAYVSQTDTYLYENTSTPGHLRRQFQYDDYGNRTQDLNLGQIVDNDPAYGEDELLTYTDYALDEANWILDRPSRIIQQDLDGGFVRETRLYYDGQAHVGLPLGAVTQGNLMRREESLGPLDGNRFVDTERYRYDEHGSVVEIQDANGHMRTIGYDLILETYPVTETVLLEAGKTLVMTAAYDLGLGVVTLARDFAGASTLYTWDTFGRLDSIVRPGDSLQAPTQSFTYTLANPVSGILTRIRERSGQPDVRQRATYFDGLGRQLMIQEEAEAGQVAVRDAVSFGQRGSVVRRFYPYYAEGPLGYEPPQGTLPALAVTYDVAGRVVQEIEPDATARSVQYLPLHEVHFDEEDNRAASPHSDTPTTYFYDGLERLRGVEEMAGSTSLYTGYEYDPAGRLTRIEDAQGNVTTQVWDGLGRKREMISPDAGRKAFSYDDVGNLAQTVDNKGQTVTFRYDAANRIIAEDFAGTPGDDIVYHYDEDLSPLLPGATYTLGRLSAIEDSGGVEAFSYDARGNVIQRLRTIEDRQFLTGTSYDASDRVTGLTYPDGTALAYTYNTMGLLESIPGYVDNVDYAASGKIAEVGLANGIVTHYAFDARQRLQTLESAGHGRIYNSFAYQYDAVSNITAVADQRSDRTLANDMTAAYQYDDLYRLTQDGAAVGETDFGLDGIGNIITQTSTAPEPLLNLGAIQHGQGAGPHAPTTVAGAPYTYDGNGNLIDRPGLSLTYDYRDRLASATAADGTTVTFLYDANNLRLLKRITYPDGSQSVSYYPDQYSEVHGDRIISFVWAGNQRVAQIGAPADIPTYDHRVHLPLVLRNNTGQLSSGTTGGPPVYFFHPNHLGSTHLVTDLQGRIVEEVLYYPYGLVRSRTGTPVTHHTFAGMEEIAELGLYYAGARHYDPMTGRFLSLDPLFQAVEGMLQNPQDLNPLLYALGNPVKNVDAGGDFPRASDWLQYAFYLDYGVTPDQALATAAQYVEAQVGKVTGFVSQQTAEAANRVIEINAEAARGMVRVLPSAATAVATTNPVLFFGASAQTASLSAGWTQGLSSVGATLEVGRGSLALWVRAEDYGLGAKNTFFGLGNAELGVEPIASYGVPGIGSVTATGANLERIGVSANLSPLVSLGLAWDRDIIYTSFSETWKDLIGRMAGME